MKEALNIDQSPEDLRDVYTRDYYWYLRSPQFHAAFLSQVGCLVNQLGYGCLDVGCGEGQLSEHVTGRYYGIDGSDAAIASAKIAYPERSFRQQRFEDVDEAQWQRGLYRTVVFGGIMEVLVKPAYRVPLMERYREALGAQAFVIYDLSRLDTSEIEQAYELTHCAETTLRFDALTGDGADAKKRRKIMVFRCV